MFWAIVHGETNFGSFLGDLHPNSGLGFSYFSVLIPFFGHFRSFLGDLDPNSGLGFNYFSVLIPNFGHFWVICILYQGLASVFGNFFVETDFGSFLGH